MSYKIDWATHKIWVPDYANQNTTNLFSSSTTTTATDNGWIYVYWEGYYNSNAVEAKITINGKTVSYMLSENTYGSGTARTGSITGMFPVIIGDVVKVQNVAVTGTNRKEALFIPGKWVSIT